MRSTMPRLPNGWCSSIGSVATRTDGSFHASSNHQEDGKRPRHGFRKHQVARSTPQGCQVGGGHHPIRVRHVSHGSLDGRRAGEDRPEAGGDLRLAPQGVGQHRSHPRRRGDLQGVHPGVAGRPRRHLRAAAAQHRPRGRRQLPAGRRGVPRQGPRGRLLPIRLARVQLLHFRPSEERAGLGITAAELLCRQSRGDPERVGRVRRQPVAVPHLDIHFINKPEIFTKAHLPPQKFDDDGNLMDPETKEQLRKMLLSLQAFALRLQGKTASSEQGN